MEMKIDPKQVHEKIINVLKEKGPSLPINIAKSTEMSSLFISAFLSELTNQKKIKVSNLKVGGSPLYYLDGQEEKLEDFYQYLHPRESESFLLLKENKILKDADQDPTTRVALRAIKDFAIAFKINEEVYWKYIRTSKEEANSLIYENKLEEEKSKEVEVKQNQKKNWNEEEIKISQTKKESTPKENIFQKEKTEIFQNPLAIKQVEKKKEKPKSDFVNKTIEFIKNKNLEILKEEDYKSKEYNCILQIKSELGPIKFVTQAKDKKTISESDLKKLLGKAQSIPFPAFIIYTGQLSKKAKEYLKEYNSILKAKKII